MARPPKLTGHGWIWLIAAGALAFGCGGGDGRPEGSGSSDTDEQEVADDDADDDNDDAEVPDRTENCESGTVEECRIEIPEVAGVKNCALGLRLCEDGLWSPCSRESEIAAKLAEGDPES